MTKNSFVVEVSFKDNNSHIHFKTFEINKRIIYVPLKAFDNKKRANEKNLKYLSDVLQIK